MRFNLLFLLFFFSLSGLVACTSPTPPPPPPTATPLPLPPTLITTAIPTPTATLARPSPLPTLTATLPPATQLLPTGYPIAEVTATPSPTWTATPSPTATPFPTVDFPAVRTQLEAQGQALAFSKIGFHVGPGGNRNGLGEWMERHTAAGVPFFLKSVNDSSALVEAQNLAKSSGVPHTLVYRHVGGEYDTPLYDLPPDEAALRHWNLHKAAWPPELDRSLVWFETINEVDKKRSAWLAEFALATAQLALQEGVKWAAFSWASGEPEVEHWESELMLQFLRLVAQHPNQLAIALHEYSYLTSDIKHLYPYKVGRFQFLFEVCDKYGIPRPTVLITEWGWEYNHTPDPEKALQDMAWAAALYAPYPEVKGAAIWYLGPGFDDIAHEAQRLIYPSLVYNLTTYFTIPAGQKTPINPEQHRP